MGVVGAVYLMAIFLGSAGSSLPDDLLPRPFRYFTQVACLFPNAARFSVEYRVSAFSCSDGQFVEFDHRPHFPMRPDDKENRFHRVGHFYRRNNQVMTALEDYLVERHNATVASGRSSGDGVDGPIGGILVMSLRIPLPEPGARADRFRSRPLAEVPRDWKKYWHITPADRRQQRCEQAP